MTEQEKSTHVLKFLSELLEGDRDKIRHIASLAINSIEKDVEGIYIAYESKDATKAHDHLHKMKSNLANLDFKELSARTPDYKSHDFWHVIPNYLRDVNTCVIQVKNAIQ
ncbi:MAG: hypothetical protein HRT61_12020 [Ekhidna sp.]|nr:hypothetical protein [Ekhidna sp.]